MFLFTSYQQGVTGRNGCCNGPQMVYQLSYVRDSAANQRCNTSSLVPRAAYTTSHDIHCIVAVFN